jgi:hypothetical protein
MLSSLSLLVLDQRFRRPRFVAAILLFLLIVAIGSIPGARADIDQFAPGIVLHGVAYSFISLLLFTGCNGERGQRAAKAIVGAMLMGAMDESVQSMLPYRTAALTDWLIDVTAALLTTGLLWTLLPSWTMALARRQ